MRRLLQPLRNAPPTHLSLPLCSRARGLQSIPYSELSIGVPKETVALERRVAQATLPYSCTWHALPHAHLAPTSRPSVSLLLRLPVHSASSATPRPSQTPETVKRLTKEGFTVRVEAGAGALADFSDEAYRLVLPMICSARAMAWWHDRALSIRDALLAHRPTRATIVLATLELALRPVPRPHPVPRTRYTSEGPHPLVPWPQCRWRAHREP